MQDTGREEEENRKAFCRLTAQYTQRSLGLFSILKSIVVRLTHKVIGFLISYMLLIFRIDPPSVKPFWMSLAYVIASVFHLRFCYLITPLSLFFFFLPSLLGVLPIWFIYFFSSKNQPLIDSVSFSFSLHFINFCCGLYYFLLFAAFGFVIFLFF